MEEKITRRQRAEKLFKMGYNCSQSVAGAFCDMTGLTLESTAKLASSFGGGFGRLREVCGAVSGMMLVLGICDGYSDPTDNITKKAHYEKVQKLAGEFRDINGSIICRELLNGMSNGDGKDNSPNPAERTAEYYKKRPCAELVGIAAEILDRYFEL